METFEEKVERIAKAWFEDQGPDWDDRHHITDWDHGHPDDKAFARYTVAFILRTAGVE